MRIGSLITGIVFAGIIILLLANFVSILCSRPLRSKERATSAALKTLHNAVLQFKTDTGRYPTKEEGLGALLKKPTDVSGWNIAGYIECVDLPLDAWNNDFIYLVTPGQRTPFVIISLGADGQKGGQGRDADLYSCDQASRQTRR